MKKTAFLLLSLISSSAFGATATTTFLVTAQVLAGCIVAALPLAFGIVDPTAIGNTDVQTTVTPTCTIGTTYTVGLNAGTGSGSTVTTRKMTGLVFTTATINYSLFRDAAHTLNWGNTPGTDTVNGTGIGLPQILTVYGRVPGGQLPAPIDSYQDLITVTVTF